MDKTNKNTIGKYSFASYTERDRTEKEERKGYVSFGDKNDYPSYLGELYMTSATHHALVDSISYMIAGKDIKVEGVDANLAVRKYHLDEIKGLLAFDLKMYGSYAYEIVWDKKGDVFSIEHLPMCNLRPEVQDEEGNVNHWYYCEDWEDRKKIGMALESPIEVLGLKEKQTKAIVVVKTPTPDSNYFSKPDYIGSLNYIELEKEISTFHVNNIKNGFFPSAFLIWKNGIPTDEERRIHDRDMENDLAGAQNAGKIVNLYASDADSAPDVHSFDTNDADSMYQFLSEETTNKIMIGHRVTTPSLFGVKTEGQLGNIQEMETGSVLFEANVIEPFRELIEDGLETFLKVLGITSEVSIPTNNPFVPVDAKSTLETAEIQSIIDIIGRTGTELTPEQSEKILGIMGVDMDVAKSFFTKEKSELDILLEGIDDDLDGYVLLDDDDASEEDEDFDFEKELNEESMKFASTGTARPNSKSDQDVEKDGVKYKVRYYYNEKYSKTDSREFCNKMMRANKLYRKEDIIQMGSKQVNSSYTNKDGRTVGWGPGGDLTYSIWLYKGGGNCGHRWFRKIFVAEGANVDVNSPNAKVISTTKARSKGVKIESNDSKVSVAPIDMPNQGFLSSIREHFRNILKK